MTLTAEYRKWHGYYESVASNATRSVIDNAYTAARKALRDAGYEAANDDRAEDLIAAITQYLVQSRDR